jgi:ribosomal protein S14
MLANKIKNIVIRKKFFKIEILNIVKKFLFVNLLSKNLKVNNKNFLLFYLNKNNRKNFSKIQVKNKCVLTGRNRSVNKKYSISRIEFRNLIRFGVIYGYKKSVW